MNNSNNNDNSDTNNSDDNLIIKNGIEENGIQSHQVEEINKEIEGDLLHANSEEVSSIGIVENVENESFIIKTDLGNFSPSEWFVQNGFSSDINSDIFNRIDEIIQQMHTNTNILNVNNEGSEYIQFDIEFEFIQHTNDNNEDLNYFKSCSEINNLLCVSEKIKKDDPLLNETCFICIDQYKCNELKRTLPSCKHCFHKKCIDKWLKKKASCPICRDNLITESP